MPIGDVKGDSDVYGGGGGGSPSTVKKYSQTFVNGDLTGNVLSVNHALNNLAVIAQVWNNTGGQSTVTIDRVDANNIDVDLSGLTPITGTWTVVVQA